MKYAVCYDELFVFENLEQLKTHFNFCYSFSEGAERERYASILIDSDTHKIATDNVSKYCTSIHVNQGDIFKTASSNIELEENMSISKAVEYYEQIVNPIMEVAKDYDVKFYRDIPFEDFGSDRDSAYGNMYSISNFYKEILEKFGINVDSIETDDKSDGKYEITINNKVIFDTCAWEKLDGVIDNVKSMLETFKEKEVELS